MYKLVKNKIDILVIFLIGKIKVAFLYIMFFNLCVMDKYYIYNEEKKVIIKIKDIVS